MINGKKPPHEVDIPNGFIVGVTKLPLTNMIICPIATVEKTTPDLMAGRGATPCNQNISWSMTQKPNDLDI